MKKLAKRVTGKEWGMIGLTVVVTCFSVYLELEVPTYISQITELLGTSGTQLDALWSPAAKMIGLSLLAFFSSVMVGFFAARVAASYTTHLRTDVFHQVLFILRLLQYEQMHLDLRCPIPNTLQHVNKSDYILLNLFQNYLDHHNG